MSTALRVTFCKNAAVERGETSRQNIVSKGKGICVGCLFLESMDKSAQLQDGHYSLKMPVRNDQLTLPNNLCMVKQRLLGLKRKFWKDELFHKAYNSFITNVIQKGYAEEVPQQQLDCGNGKVGYIPDHSVRHRRRGTFRMVFSCGCSTEQPTFTMQGKASSPPLDHHLIVLEGFEYLNDPRSYVVLDLMPLVGSPKANRS